MLASTAMDAAAALADLTAVSSQIEAAAVFDESGALLAATPAGDAGGLELVEGARSLLAAAATVRREGAPAVARIEAALHAGSVFVVSEGPLAIVAVTVPEPTSGLVAYDLRTCLRAVAAPPEKPKRRRKKADDAAS